METAAPKFLSLFLISILIVCSTGAFASQFKNFKQREVVIKKTVEHDSTDFPMTTFPTSPATATTNVPPDTPSPQIITVPSTNPAGPVPPTPVTNPTTPQVPITNPVTPPSPTTNIPEGSPATTNPTTPTGGGVPVVPPPASTGGAPVGPGQSWCVARSGVPETALQSALDYSCGIGGVDCSALQQGASCYNPNTLQNHASYAFNTYYQRNPGPTSCDFGGSAVVTNANPSSGSCIFTSSSSTPKTSSSGATPISSGTPPSILNASSPNMGGGMPGLGDGPTTANGSSVSKSSSLQPFIGYIIVVTSIITRAMT